MSGAIFSERKANTIAIFHIRNADSKQLTEYAWEAWELLTSFAGHFLPSEETTRVFSRWLALR
jgi:hypothetical protein